MIWFLIVMMTGYVETSHSVSQMPTQSGCEFVRKQILAGRPGSYAKCVGVRKA